MLDYKPPRPARIPPWDRADAAWFARHPRCGQRLRAPLPGEIEFLTGEPAAGPATIAVAPFLVLTQYVTRLGYTPGCQFERQVLVGLILAEPQHEAWAVNAIIATFDADNDQCDC